MRELRMMARERVKGMADGVNEIDVGGQIRQRQMAFTIALQQQIGDVQIHLCEIVEIRLFLQGVHLLERRHELLQQGRAAPRAAGNKKESAHCKPRQIPPMTPSVKVSLKRLTCATYR
ncbi:MAG: hypothetical protein WB713_05750 [Methyloceanibacter sp.]|jgi:hypothetical protein